MLGVDGLGASALADTVLVLAQSLQECFHSGYIGAVLQGSRVKVRNNDVGKLRHSRGWDNGLVLVCAGHKKLASIASQPSCRLDNQQIAKSSNRAKW
jgi:hypothetical protein